MTRVAVGPGRPLELDHVFTHHPPKGDQQSRYEDLRAAGLEFAEAIADMVPSSTERSTALAKVREAVMWANAGIACNENDQDDNEEA